MNSHQQQRTLAVTTGFERYTKKTRQAQFLEEMEPVVPWIKLCGLRPPRTAGLGPSHSYSELPLKAVTAGLVVPAVDRCCEALPEASRTRLEPVS